MSAATTRTSARRRAGVVTGCGSVMGETLARRWLGGARGRGGRPRLTRVSTLKKFAWLSVATAIATIALKVAAWWVTGSVGLLSDAAESVVNLVAAVIALIAVTVAERPADDDHQYGHSKAEYFSAGAEGAMIFVAAAFIVYTAVERLLNPRPLEALGVVPVAMPPALVTESLSKGVVDGASAVWEVVAPTKMDEITRNHLDAPADQPVLGATVLAMLMNQRTYDRLPADLRAIVDQHSGLTLVERFGRVWDEAGEATRQKVIKEGHEVHRLAEDDYRQVLERLKPVEQQWIAEAAAKGIDGQALLDAARALTAQAQAAR